jgi:ABC-type arginine transport system permease subunit
LPPGFEVIHINKKAFVFDITIGCIYLLVALRSIFFLKNVASRRTHDAKATTT